MTDKTDNRFYREAGEPVAWMTPSDWRNEPLATADKSVASAWRADNRQVTPLYASQPKALTDAQVNRALAAWFDVANDPRDAEVEDRFRARFRAAYAALLEAPK